MKPKTKSDETRDRILAAAIELFRSRGFAAATMREIAAAAGVATGAAYYYFDSKDAIVLAFYEHASHELEPLLEEALAGAKDLEGRVRAMLEVKLNYFEPNRSLLGALAGHTDPEHPLSPFSAQTREIRERDMKFFERALEDSHVRIAPDLRGVLPRVLWMYQMGLILFWIYDRSKGQKRTHALVDQSVGVVVGLIKLSGFPLLRPVRRRVVQLLDTVSGEGAP
jgi:AcrR family transcriptional regulator